MEYIYPEYDPAFCCAINCLAVDEATEDVLWDHLFTGQIDNQAVA